MSQHKEMNLKIFTNNIEEKAKKQVVLLMEQESFKNSKVRIMPDVHAGNGCVIGFTGNLGTKVIPSIVGVDVGCGMLCVQLNKKNIDLKLVDSVIKEFVPSGMSAHVVHKHISMIEKLRCFDMLNNHNDWLSRSMGTLGGGNYFIEIDIDNNGTKYLIIHTGSRNIGKQVAEIYQKKQLNIVQLKENVTIKSKRILVC